MERGRPLHTACTMTNLQTLLLLLGCGLAGRGQQLGAAAAPACKATLHRGMSVGGDAYRQMAANDTAGCCAACVADPRCAAFVTSAGGGGGECLLKKDLNDLHAKAKNDCGIVRTPGPMPPPTPPPPPLPPGSPQWELVEAKLEPVIGRAHPDVVEHGVFRGFETGQYHRVNGTFFYTANELGMCDGVLWDLVTRAAVWSATNSTGPWKRVATLRNGSHVFTMCNGTAKSNVPCRKLPGTSVCAGTKEDPSFVTWAPTLIHAPSSVNATGKDVWNFFYSSNQNSHYQDKAFNGITWAVSTTDSMLGPYVDVVGVNGTALPAGGEGVVNVAVNGSHSFSAWKLPNGSWAGFKNNVPGAKSFSAALIVPTGDAQTPGGAWREAGPNLASGSDCSDGLCFAPENPVVTTMST